MLDPNVLPQLTYSIYNNQDYQQLLANPKKTEDMDDDVNELIENGPNKKELEDFNKINN